ncbi:MAG: FG-GAP-like repeat-containing protein [Candidatus Paceibacterota bacterium]|jgi:hypothetical protein
MSLLLPRQKSLVFLLVGVVVFLCGLGAASSVSALSFGPIVYQYVTGNNPTSIATADLNGDGHFDLIVPNGNDGTISILLGDGSGAFSSASGSPIAGTDGMLRPQTADFNSDGKIDFVVPSSASSSMLVFLGNGDGTFSVASSSPLAFMSTDVVVDDFNGDTKKDLGIVNTTSMTILLGNGDGTFSLAPSSPMAIGADNGTALGSMGDMNGDGRKDLVILKSFLTTSTLSIFLGDGTGAFSVVSSSTVELPELYTSVVTGDINGDGRIDGTIYGFSSILSFLNHGDGTMESGVAMSYSPSMIVGGIALAHINNDSFVDIVVGPGASEGSLGIFLGDGDGTFHRSNDLVAGGGPGYVAVADFNGDGLDDFAVCESGASIGIIIKNSDGTFQTVTFFSIGSAAVGYIAAADVTGDGKVDLLVSRKFENNITTFHGDGSGHFSALATTTAPASDVLRMANFTNDGKPDLIAGSVLSGGYLSVLLGDASGGFVHATGSPFNAQIKSVYAADFTNDGSDDIVFGSSLASTTVWLGNGDGTFSPAPEIATQSPGPIAGGFFNVDGSRDIAVTSPSFKTVSIFFGNGDGTFVPSGSSITLGFNPRAIATGDCNGDGKADIGIVGVNTKFLDNPSLAILLNDGAGNFLAPVYYPMDVTPDDLSFHDFNQDGIDDVMVAGSSQIAILLANGDGTLQSPLRYSVGVNAGIALSADLNGDNRFDAVTGDTAGNVFTLFNLTPPTVTAVTPASIMANTPTKISVTGVGFAKNSSIEINNMPYASTVVSDQSMEIPGLMLGGSGNYSVGVFNPIPNKGSVASNAITLSVSQVVSSGGGLPPTAYEKPYLPLGISIVGSSTTATTTVVLALIAGSNVEKVALSTDPTLAGATQYPFEKTKTFNLCPSQNCPAGLYTVYARYFTGWGQGSDAVSSSVFYAPTPLPFSISGESTTTNASSGTVFTFKKNLMQGSIGTDVKKLQQFLNTHGFFVARQGPGSLDEETFYFGSLTKAALISFQDAHRVDILAPAGLTKGTGFFGPLTRSYINSLLTH